MKPERRTSASGPLARSASDIHRTAVPPPPASTSTHRTGVPNAPPSPSIHSTETPVSERANNPALTNLRRNLSPSEFNTAMVHFYRGEVQRSNTWRNRLDTTTNWAVLTAGATLSFAFSAPSNPHFVILINSIVVAIFLFMEARRYRYYEIWSSRVRVLETEYFARLLAPEASRKDEWAVHLADDLLTPHFTISEWEALGRRLRRNYLWIFLLLAASWNLKVYVHPTPVRSFAQFIERSAVGVVPGDMILLMGVLFNVGLFVFALATVRLREATGEVLPEHQFTLPDFRRVTSWTPAAIRERRTTIRAKRARARAARMRPAGSVTGEHKRLDPERDREEVSTRE
ncbi:MAG TPA: DUF2270 domain-containing protein [Pyrinomonadaceae bacterium]|nr:DUF2270 domain-containing protein [Pyrinomonadaceae bacterium]